MALIDLQRRVVATCFGPEPSAEQLAALGDGRVWGLYRKMIRGRIRGELKAAFRKTYAALGRDGFERMLDAYLLEAPPRTRFFYALPGEVAQLMVPRLRADASVPPFAADLLAYEAALRCVADLPDRAPAVAGEFAFDKRPLLAPALRLVALEHAVHKPAGDDGGYERAATQLCVYRRAEDKRARVWSLNPVMFALMQRFAAQQEPVQASIQQVAVERNIALDASFVDGLCTVLADFIERGVILGGI
jgi:hypothetical protein